MLEEKLSNKDKEMTAKQQVLDFSAKSESEIKEKLASLSVSEENKNQEIQRLKVRLPFSLSYKTL